MSTISDFTAIVVAVLGVILTLIQIKKNFRDEIKRRKKEIQVDEMSGMAIDIMEFINDARNPEIDKNLLAERVIYIRSAIFAYGSKNAIRIYSEISQEHFKEKTNKYALCVLYPLLISQIRYDVTGEAISPDYWYKFTITDYVDNKDEFRKVNNEYVQKLKLNKKFEI